MGLRINDTIPDLTVETDQGSFSLHEFVGDSWAILFSHPKDFTPVCTTEFGAVAQLGDDRGATDPEVGVLRGGVQFGKARVRFLPVQMTAQKADRLRDLVSQMLHFCAHGECPSGQKQPQQ